MEIIHPRVYEDRITHLSTELHSNILRLLPFKTVIEMSTLSRQWKAIVKDFLPYVENIEFLYEENVEIDEFIDNVNKFCHLHRSPVIRSVKINFAWADPSIEEHKRELNRWIEFAARKSVNDLDVYCPLYDEWSDLFVVPNLLFACLSITSLKLSDCRFNPPRTFGGLKSLRFLYLQEAYISNKAFKATLENCLLLEELTLWDCYTESKMRILAPKDSQIKILLVIQSHPYDSEDEIPTHLAREIKVAAPNLKKFCIYGRLFDKYQFQNHLSLEEVCIDSTVNNRAEKEMYFEDYFDHLRLLRDACNIKILTIYEEVIADVSELGMRYDLKDELHFNLPITMPNLQELQICLGMRLTKKYLVDIYAFFNNFRFPKLEKLFIEVGYHDYGMYESYSNREESEEEEGDGSLTLQVRMVKFNHFHGSKAEYKLLKFVLRKATLLELMVVVAAKKSDLEKYIIDVQQSTGNLSEFSVRLQQLAKESGDAKVLLCREGEVNLFPTQTKLDWHSFNAKVDQVRFKV